MLMIDNEPAIRLAQNLEYYRLTKHNHIRHFFVRELIFNGDISIGPEQQIAHVLAKPPFKLRSYILRQVMRLNKLSMGT